jgi:hypothetical protein
VASNWGVVCANIRPLTSSVIESMACASTIANFTKAKSAGLTVSASTDVCTASVSVIPFAIAGLGMVPFAASGFGLRPVTSPRVRDPQGVRRTKDTGTGMSIP